MRGKLRAVEGKQGLEAPEAEEMRLLEALQVRQLDPRNASFGCLDAAQWSADGTLCGSGVINLKAPTPPLAISFSKERGDGHLLAVCNEDGYVKIFDTRQQLLSSLNYDSNTGNAVRSSSWLAHDNAVFDLHWMQSDSEMLTASGDQTIKLWSTETHMLIATHRWHTGSVKSLSVHPLCSSAFVSSGRDGNVAFWDTRGNNQEVPVASIVQAHRVQINSKKKWSQTVTAVAHLGDGNLLATAGAGTGLIKFWDCRSLKRELSSAEAPELPETSRLHGYTSLSVDATGTKIIGSATNNQIHMFNVTQPQKGPIKTFTGLSVGSFYVKSRFSPDSGHILSGSSDGNAYIWKVSEPDRPVRLEGHLCEVTAVDWCPGDKFKVATCSDDFTARVWVPGKLSSSRVHHREDTSESGGSQTVSRKRAAPSSSPVSVLSVPRCRTKQRTLEKWLT